MPRLLRLIIAILIYAIIMVVVSRTVNAWALPPEERTFESVATRIGTILVFGVISAAVVYHLFVRSSGDRRNVR